jgi:hypothetical protein
MVRTLWAMSAGALALELLWIAPAGAEAQIGAVAMLGYQGASGTRVTGETRDLVYEATVYSDERVDTEKDEATNLVFLDQTNLYVGERSSVLLDKFIYDPDSQKGAVAISFVKGAFRFITGQIKNKQNVSLRTPTASMVIRGTQLLLYVLPDGTTEVNLEEGEVDVFICDRPAPVRVSTGESLLISSSCQGSKGRAREPSGDSLIPELPEDYLALLEIEPAAGDDSTPGDYVPEWLRGKRGSEHDHNSGGYRR